MIENQTLHVWLSEGDPGVLLCTSCGILRRHGFDCPSCTGCPVAWRRVNGTIEYWRTPVHGYHKA